ncbi:hypothetical protein SAMN05518672_11088 [Chitinophaga sp. CF118]|uniref:TapB family protein n=1 Tax=Chitinophaga sp. CF118 TaxID=1884367 RepID=UPI0008E5843B|nr:hypothetical protein [Chitinophaga sp. CF118]SFE78840.1 hypothetical protein SAMN05518672_11088 [Chitinophaga sp. CF118]
MKKSLFFIAVLVAAVNSLTAQDCKNYYYLRNNSEVEMSVYDGKKEIVAKNIYNVLSVNKEGTSLVADFTSTVKDAKGEELSTGKGKVKCDGDNLLIDMQMNMPNIPQVQAMKMETGKAATFLSYPNALKVGETLPEGSFEMNSSTNGMDVTIQYKVANRKVVAKEKVTTSAGTWDCFKITYDVSLALKMMAMSMPFDMIGAEWFAPGFGVVKTEFNKDGQSMGSMLITKVKK